jgi:hypothetical protein
MHMPLYNQHEFCPLSIFSRMGFPMASDSWEGNLRAVCPLGSLDSGEAVVTARMASEVQLLTEEIIFKFIPLKTFKRYVRLAYNLRTS